MVGEENMTKEEFYQKYEDDYEQFTDFEMMNKEVILKMLEEYGKQEAIAFHKFIEDWGYNDRAFTGEELYASFLKLKTKI